MAPLPEQNTARVWFDYETAADGVEHTVMVRVDGTSLVPVESAGAALLGVLGAIGVTNFRQGWRVIRARVALAGGLISFPAALPAGLAAFVGSNATPLSPTREALEGRFVGRGLTSGRRVSLSLWGWSSGIDPGNFRIARGASGFPLAVGGAVDALNEINAGAFCTIAGDNPLWYPYLNLQYNSYWERRLRLS